MFKKLLILVILLSANSNIVYSLENKILFKINNEIITTIDISNEINYLQVINHEIKTLNQNTKIEMAKNNLIKDKIKEIELLKNISELEIDDKYLKFLIKNLYLRIGLNDLEAFKKYLNNHNVKIEMIKNKFLIDNNWKRFIYAKYKNQIKIDKGEILNEVKNRKSKIFKLSEILFTLNEGEILEEKFNVINKSILENGFENTALIYSISDSSKKGGDLGWVNSTTISSKILKEISLININEYSNPIIVPGGFLILKIQDYKEKRENNNIDEEVEKVINRKINNQLNTYSNLYLNKLTKDIKVNEL